MKVVLLLTLILVGQEKPAQQAVEMKDLKTCEAEVHRFLTHKLPDEVRSKLVVMGAGCNLVVPGTPS